KTNGARSTSRHTSPSSPQNRWRRRSDATACGTLPPGPTIPADVDAGADGGSDASVPPEEDDGGPPLPFPRPTHYWSFDTPTIAGTTLNAVRGGLSGTLTAGATTTPGKIGQGLSLNGSTGTVDFGDVLDDAIAGAGRKFSVAMWINVPGPFVGVGDNGYG